VGQELNQTNGMPANGHRVGYARVSTAAQNIESISKRGQNLRDRETRRCKIRSFGGFSNPIENILPPGLKWPPIRIMYALKFLFSPK
jgi:hypothetical protein